METGTGKTRHEFSGPGAADWYAAFLPDATGIVGSQLFSTSASIWPTTGRVVKVKDWSKGWGGEPKPEATKVVFTPTTTFSDLKAVTVTASVSPDGGLVLLGLHNGSLALRALAGEAPALAPIQGKRPSTVSFTASGRYAVALHEGVVHAWTLPRPAAK